MIEIVAKIHFRKKNKGLFFQGIIPKDFEDILMSKDTIDQISGVKILIIEIDSIDKTEKFKGMSDTAILREFI